MTSPSPLWFPLLLCLGCSGADLTLGLEEPLQVHGAQFVRGELPGSEPSDEPREPHPTSAGLLGRIIEQGSDGLSLSGRASPTTDAIAVALSGSGTGYWVLPVGAPDPQFNNEPTWGLNAALNRELVGVKRLRVAAVDANGKSGSQSEVEFCVTPRIPDNLNACSPTRKPPALVVSLGWDSDVDLDLVVITPKGKVVSPKDPNTAVPDEDGNLSIVANTGVFDLDSNAACQLDGRRLENLVFEERPEPGRYLIYANLFDACNADSVRFTVSLHTAEPGEAADTFSVEQALEVSGVLGGFQANAGTKPGTFVTQFQAR